MADFRDVPHLSGPFPRIVVKENLGEDIVDRMALAMFSISEADPETVASEHAFDEWQNNATMRRDTLAARERGAVVIKGALTAERRQKRPRLGDRILDPEEVAVYNGLSNFEITAAYSDAALFRDALGSLDSEHQIADATKRQVLPQITFTPEFDVA